MPIGMFGLAILLLAHEAAGSARSPRRGCAPCSACYDTAVLVAGAIAVARFALALARRRTLG